MHFSAKPVASLSSPPPPTCFAGAPAKASASACAVAARPPVRRDAAGMEFVSPEGLRLDGRRPREARQLRCRLGPLAAADGSALFEMGNTKVLAAVYGPREVPLRRELLHDKCSIRVDYSMAPFALSERRKGRGGRDRRSMEQALVLRQTAEAAVLTELLPRSQIVIAVKVLQADGGQRACAVNAMSMALADAGVPMRDTLAACAAGFLDGAALLDLNHQEEMGNGAQLVVATLPRHRQMENKLAMDAFEGVLALAESGCDVVAAYMRTELLARTRQLAVARAAERA